ncbi:hypothetical protein XELAEV_18041580mg [Xenopus laevis]|uniref:Uncharacterized protein n=1 Tax=Xenopus laevis TaxID=8355 RepID=A0A974C3P3_XENLA|nr:hypothetical protein XELAEV_18041580mg [Xenopus laevis]
MLLCVLTITFLFCPAMQCRLALFFIWPFYSRSGSRMVLQSVCAPHLLFCLGRLHQWFFILYVPITFPSVWAGSICGSSFCMYPTPSLLSGQGPSVVPYSVCTPHLLTAKHTCHLPYNM